MKFSIITVVYNNEDTIIDTLRSVAAQTYPDIEHIVIDGASTDSTLARITEHGQHVAQLLSEPDHGIYDAMNKGVALATGDIICFLNADDFYAHDGILTTVATEMRSKELDIFYGDVAYYHPKNPGRTVRCYSSRHFTPEKLAYGWMPAHPAFFVRKELFAMLGNFKTNYRIAGDFEFIARLFTKLTPHYSYRPEVMVQMRTGGISTAGWRSTLLLNQEIVRACRENGIQTNVFKLLARYPHKVLELIFS